MPKQLLLKNGQIDTWPATINTLKTRMPRVSFPKKVSPPFTCKEYSLIEPIATTKPDGYKVTEVKPIQSGIDWLQQWESRNATPEEIANDQAKESERLKIEGMTFNGVKISLTEENQNGIAAVQVGLETSVRYGQNPTPMNFKAAGPEGATLITFATVAEFEAFGLQFMAARQAFFL